MTQRTTLAALWHSITLFAISLAFLACSDGNVDDPNPEVIKGNSSLLLNFTSDYETGELRWMTDADSTSLSPGKLSFGQDSKVFASGENIFVLERTDRDNLSCMQANKFGVIQNALEQGANAYEVAVTGNKGYIVFNGADYVQTFNVNTCILGEKIMLPVTQANASSIKISGDTLLVLSQRLDGYTATKPGLLIRINTGTKALIDTIPLKFYNPHSAVLSDGKLYVSSQGAYNPDFSINTEVSGVEAVDLKTGTSEIIASGTDLGGGSSDIALDEENQVLYASIYISWGDNPVKPVDLKTKKVGSALQNIKEAGGGLVFDKETGKLFVGDRAEGQGLKIYNTIAKTTILANGGDPLLPPYSLAIARW